MNPGDLLRIKRQIITQDTCGLFYRHFAHERHIIEQASDVVYQGK